MDEKQGSWLKNLVLRLFEPGESQEEDERPGKENGGPSIKEMGSSEPAEQARAPRTAAIPDRMLALKNALRNALEFETEVESRLRKIQSSQDLLLYVYEVVLFKFATLREIGLMSDKAEEVVNLLHEKLETFLVRPESVPGEKQRMELEVLRKENEQLKTRMSDLQARYVKSGIISEKETELEKEGAYLKRRVTELTTYLQLFKKKMSSLAAVQETNHSLRARNSLLNTKVEHQRRLLQSLTASQPQQQELISTIDKLAEENKRLKEQFKNRSGLVEQLQMQVPGEGQSKEAIKGLMEENARLRTEMEEDEKDLDGLQSAQPDVTLVDSLERLQEENARIKAMLEAKQSLFDALENEKQQGGDSASIAEMMRRENERLKQMVSEKKETIKTLSDNPSSKILMSTLFRLKNEKKDLIREVQIKEQLCQQLEQEKKQLQDHTRNSDATNKKIRQLMGELDFNKKLVVSLKKAELEYVTLKKEHSQIRTQFAIALKENKDMEKKLTRVTTEYELLVKEYENIFDKI